MQSRSGFKIITVDSKLLNLVLVSDHQVGGVTLQALDQRVVTCTSSQEAPVTLNVRNAVIASISPLECAKESLELHEKVNGRENYRT